MNVRSCMRVMQGASAKEPSHFPGQIVASLTVTACEAFYSFRIFHMPLTGH